MSQEQQDIADLKAWRKVVEPTLREIHSDIKLLLSKSNAQNCTLHADKLTVLESDVSSLKSNRDSIKGGWWALGVIAACLVGLAGMAGVLAAWLTIKH